LEPFLRTAALKALQSSREWTAEKRSEYLFKNYLPDTAAPSDRRIHFSMTQGFAGAAVKVSAKSLCLGIFEALTTGLFGQSHFKK
jgi:hypothetical protein